MMAGGLSPLRLGGELETWKVYSPLRSVAETFALVPRTVRLAVKPPYKWIPDALAEANLIMSRVALPLLISQCIWIIGFAVLNFGEIASTLGVADRLPGGAIVGFIREVSTWITMMILAGVAGSALTADLGARKIRDELAAMDVLGVDKFRVLLVPRVAAMVYAALVMGLIGSLMPMVAYILLYPSFTEISVGVYLDSIYENLKAIDLFSSIIKHFVMGLFIALVACQRGLDTEGGAEGVGRAVTQTVIVTFFGIWLLNSIWNIALITVAPELLVPRG